MQLQLVDGVSILLSELECDEVKQKDIALTYALLITSNDRPVDWPTVNKAIIDRFGMPGLKRIKSAAWKTVDARRQALGL